MPLDPASASLPTLTEALVSLVTLILIAATIKVRRWIKDSSSVNEVQAVRGDVATIRQKVDRQSDELIKAKAETAAHREKVEGTLAEVKKQLTTNGGGTLRDEVQALQHGVEAVGARLRIMADEQEWVAWDSDADGRCTWASRSICGLLQRSFDEIAGDSWRSFIHEPDRDRVYREWDTAVHQRRIFDLSYHWIRSDGWLLPIAARAYPLKTNRGEVTGYTAKVTLLGPAIPPARRPRQNGDESSEH